MALKIQKKIKDFLLSSQVFPILLSVIALSILLILFRMKSVETHYAILQTQNEVDTAKQENKELRAQKARMLSVSSLKIIAQRHNLKEPATSQILVIP